MNGTSAQRQTYNVLRDSMLRGDRAASSAVFDHAKSIQDKKTALLSYYAMSGPNVIDGTPDQIEHDLAYLESALIDSDEGLFANLEEVGEATHKLAEEGQLVLWMDYSTDAARQLVDIPVRAPGGALHETSKSDYPAGAEQIGNIALNKHDKPKPEKGSARKAAALLAVAGAGLAGYWAYKGYKKNGR